MWQGSREPHGLAVRQSLRMVNFLTVYRGRFMLRMSTSIDEFWCSTVNVRRNRKYTISEANDSRDRALMSGQPNPWCLKVNPAPPATSEPFPRQMMGQVSHAQDSFIQDLIYQLRIVPAVLALSNSLRFPFHFWSKTLTHSRADCYSIDANLLTHTPIQKIRPLDVFF